MCLDIYELNPHRFLSTIELAWQAALKKTKVKLDLLGDIDLLVIYKKVSEMEHVMLFIDMRKLITNT